jgi:hypothetical protein
MTESNFIKKLSGIPPWPVRFPNATKGKCHVAHKHD